jgi:hypothetical protein
MQWGGRDGWSFAQRIDRGQKEKKIVEREADDDALLRILAQNADCQQGEE